MSPDEVIERHRARGRFFQAAGVRSFALDEGSGEAVVMLHGVPVSCFLYRKVVAELAPDFRAVAFDFPGLGLAERPADFDYSWSGLARFAESALDSLELDRAHFVVHDVGGPVGFEVCIRNPDRVLSLTALNTLVNAAGFRRPWSMHPFSIRGLGELWLRSLNGPLFVALMRLQGIANMAAVPREELLAHFRLIRRGDGGRAFLKIMRGFELTAEKERFLRDGLAARTYPAQVAWGADDPALPLATRGEEVRAALGVDEVVPIPAKHFLQEDQAPAVAERIRSIAGRAREPSAPDAP
jgi:pimeloyl-ACP methyl ester carboxylesterase